MIKQTKESKYKQYTHNLVEWIYKMLSLVYVYDLCMAQRNHLLTEVCGFCWYEWSAVRK